MSRTQGPASAMGKVVAEAEIACHGPPVALETDRLEYLADMISEMRTLAARSGHTTLAGLLALAFVEAKQQGDKLKPR